MRTIIISVVILFIITTIKGKSDGISSEQKTFEKKQVDFTDQKNGKLSVEDEKDLKEALILNNNYAFNKSTSILIKLSERNPHNEQINMQLAHAYKNQGNLALSNNCYRKVIAVNSDNVQAKVALAGNLTFMKELNESVVIYKELLKGDNENSFILNKIARCFDLMEKGDSALTYYNKSLKSNPCNYIATTEAALIYAKMGKHKSGLKIVQDYLKKDTTSIVVNRYNAFFHFKTKKYTDAVSLYNKCISKGDTVKACYKNLGICYFGLKKYDHAYDNLLTAYKKDTTDSETCLTLGMTCSHTAYTKMGIDYIKRAIELVSGDPKYVAFMYNKLADAYNQCFMYDKALASLKKSNELVYKPITLYRIAYQFDHLKDEKDSALSYYYKFKNSLPKKDAKVKNPPNTVTYLEAVNRRIDYIKEQKFWKEKQ